MADNFHHRFRAMGGPCHLHIRTDSEQQAQSLFAAMEAEVRRLEQKYSRYRDDSVTAEINTGAGRSSAVKLDQETAKLLQFADLLYQQSDGLFDITSGVFRRVWDFRAQRIPSQAAIDEVRAQVGWSQCLLDDESFRLPRAGMEIDFGGFVKEYAVDACVGIGTANSTVSGLVDLSGDVGVFGAGPPWRIGIQHPRQDSAISCIELSAGCLASSGDYERYFEAGGKRYCHIINPESGYPVQGCQGVSVLAPQCIVAGGLATITLLKEKSGKAWLDSVGVRYCLIDADGEMHSR